MVGRRSMGIVVLVAGLTLATACVQVPSFANSYAGKVFLTYEVRDAGDNVVLHGDGETARTYRILRNQGGAESGGTNYTIADQLEKVLASEGYDGALGEYEWEKYSKTHAWCFGCAPVVDKNFWLWLPIVPGEPRPVLSFYEQDTSLIINDPVVEPWPACDDGDAQVFRVNGPLANDPTQTGSVTIANC